MSARGNELERAYRDLAERLAEVDDLRRVGELLGWDRETMMPPAGSPARAEQQATLTRIAHERFTSVEIGRLLEKLRPFEEGLPYDSDEASVIRVARRQYEKATRVPAELKAEITRAGVIGYDAWVDARARSDYTHFRPHLENAVELKLRYIECFDGEAAPYDVLLDDYECGMTTTEVARLFDTLKARLIPLVARIGELEPVDDSFLRGAFPVAAQERVTLTLLEELGFSRDAWRLDVAVHPFQTSMSPSDVRLTTRYAPTDLTSIHTALHEYGHGLYDAGVDASLARTPVSQSRSLALHESQSRLWENTVGRSRPFWQRFFPLVRDAFEDALRHVDAEQFYRALNKTEPSFIRVDADEATYNLHIVLRFELEQEILAGGLNVRDLPHAWNERTAHYLGLDVPDDARGVLQDVHWADAGFGYFPTYTLGNLVGTHIWKRALDDDAVRGGIEEGDYGELHAWLRERLYRHGGKFTLAETVERLVGASVDPGAYLSYLEGKLSDVYGVELGATQTASADESPRDTRTSS